jgi:hypothetical protein
MPQFPAGESFGDPVAVNLPPAQFSAGMGEFPALLK